MLRSGFALRKMKEPQKAYRPAETPHQMPLYFLRVSVTHRKITFCLFQQNVENFRHPRSLNSPDSIEGSEPLTGTNPTWVVREACLCSLDAKPMEQIGERTEQLERLGIDSRNRHFNNVKLDYGHGRNDR